ncbi:hypothetical protein DTL42_03650 [Bremerella cremea]|uniref:Uncharacterized protein n=1 Tax=Bremerella cremea TaxID=1031537 RepID=A0A368KVA6_9BACT|nr:hypothetical protein [Bremerella cremea]RCS54251.1 hypothetical protein DTL42_03650 [Bremerella cremea]
MIYARCLILLLGFVLSASAVQADGLPEVSSKPPVPIDHFPDALHAVVWRNWSLVPAARLAEVLATTPENVTDIATSMGLPADPYVSPQMATRGYITLVRRNWHLLPYDQLLQLLQIDEEEFAHRLREDDFLLIKLGNMKPNCPPVRYAEPSSAAKARAAEIKQLVERTFGDQLKQPHEPPFQFIEELSQVDPAFEKLPPPQHDADHPRFIYSYFAMFGDPLSDPTLDPFPDGLLARLQQRGVNGVWLHVVLRDLAPPTADFPEFGEGHRERLQNLAKLVERAKKYGIDVYLYMNEPRAMPESFFDRRPEMKGVPDPGSPVPYFAMCTSHPKVRAWVSDSLAYIFERVPNLGGVFTITASENLTNCSSKFTQAACPHCKDRSPSDILVEINTAIADGVHRSAPAAKVIAWDWGWARHGDASETVAKLPPSIWLMSVSEWQLPIERGGVKAVIGEYSISAVGPGPRATKHWQVAQENGLHTLAKVQFNITWEIAAVPYVPVMNLIAQHNANLAEANLDGQMLSWSLGGYPSPNLELAKLFAENPKLTVDQALDLLAESTYGKAGAAEAKLAWQHFSDGYAEYPYSSSGMYTGPQHVGPANLLYAEPTGYSPGMVCFPYDGLARWSSPFPPEIYAQQFQKIADGFAEGCQHLEAAAKAAPADKQAFAADDLSVARAAQLHFASVAQQARYIIARDQLAAAKTPEQQQPWRQAAIDELQREIDTTVRLYPVVAGDSRIGYEASNHYFYVPQDLIEKVINCEHLKQTLAP